MYSLNISGYYYSGHYIDVSKASHILKIVFKELCNYHFESLKDYNDKK